MAVVEHRFRVMASETRVILVNPTSGADLWAEHRLRQLETMWSRFLSDSDISRLGANPGQWIEVSVETIALIRIMKQAAVVTAGAYDPTLVYEIIEAGYVASVEESSRIAFTIDLPNLAHTVGDVTIDTDGKRVKLPPRFALDPGGIGKGLAADIVVAELLGTGTSGALVSVGGDLAANGEPPTQDGWLVTIEDPFDPSLAACTVSLDRGGVSTSSTLSRRWRQGGSDRHHVLDPSTRRSSTTDLASVSVVASTGWLAEAHATAALLRGSAGVLAYLTSHGLEGLAVTSNGRYLATAALEPSQSKAHSS